MATCRTEIGRDAVSLTAPDYFERCNTLIEAARAKLRTPTDPLAGEVISFPMGDGCAQYIVKKSKPLTLIHIALGDAWDIPAAHMRGLTLADVAQQVERERQLRELLEGP